MHQVQRVEAHANDVRSGRGNGPNNHHGNIYFRSLVDKKTAAYTSPDASVLEKKKIINDIIANIHTLNPPGRFLKSDNITEMSYKEISKKTGMALCDNARIKPRGPPMPMLNSANVHGSSNIGEAEVSPHSTEGGYNQVNYFPSVEPEETQTPTLADNAYSTETTSNTNEELKNDGKSRKEPRKNSFCFFELVTDNRSSVGKDNTMTETMMNNIHASMSCLDLETIKKNNNTMEQSHAFVERLCSSGPFDASSNNNMRVDLIKSAPPYSAVYNSKENSKFNSKEDSKPNHSLYASDLSVDLKGDYTTLDMSNFIKSAPPYSAVYNLKENSKFHSKGDFKPDQSLSAFDLSIDMKGNDSYHHMSVSLNQSDDNLSPTDHLDSEIHHEEEDGVPPSRRQTLYLSNVSSHRQTLPIPSSNLHESDLHEFKSSANESYNETQIHTGKMNFNDKFDQSMAFDKSIAKIDFGLSSVLRDSTWKLMPTTVDSSTDCDFSTDI